MGNASELLSSQATTAQSQAKEGRQAPAAGKHSLILRLLSRSTRCCSGWWSCFSFSRSAQLERNQSAKGTRKELAGCPWFGWRQSPSTCSHAYILTINTLYLLTSKPVKIQSEVPGMTTRHRYMISELVVEIAWVSINNN